MICRPPHPPSFPSSILLTIDTSPNSPTINHIKISKDFGLRKQDQLWWCSACLKWQHEVWYISHEDDQNANPSVITIRPQNPLWAVPEYRALAERRVVTRVFSKSKRREVDWKEGHPLRIHNISISKKITDYICKTMFSKHLKRRSDDYYSKPEKYLDAFARWYSNRQWIVPGTNIRLRGFQAPSSKETSQYSIRRYEENDRFNWI